MHRPIHLLGLNIYVGNSTGTTPHSTQHYIQLLSRLCMEGILLRYYVMRQDLQKKIEMEESLKERDFMLVQIKGLLLKAKQLMKVQADKHRRPLEFNVGEAFT